MKKKLPARQPGAPWKRQIGAAFSALRPYMEGGVAVATYTNREGLPDKAVIAVDGLLAVDDIKVLIERWRARGLNWPTP